MEKFTLKDKTVLVTGASSGLGSSLAKKAALSGGKVFAATRSVNKLSDIAEEVDRNNEANGVVIPVGTDVSDPESIEALFESIDKEGQGIDIVINNAAVGHNSRLQDLNDEELSNIVNTNLLGTIRVTRESIRRMTKKGEGHLVFVSSLAGRLAFPNLSVYSATKFGMEGLTQSVREELKGTGINTTLVRPGIMDTSFFATAGMDELARKMKHKMQSPDQVADEVMKAIANKSGELTIGPDRRFMPFLKHLPESIARRLLPYIT